MTEDYSDDDDFHDDQPSPIPHEYERKAILDAALPVLDELKIPSSALRTVLYIAREDAKDALGSLISVDPRKWEEVQDLQWKVTRYDDLCTYVAHIVEAGREATEDLTQPQATALERLVRGEEPKD